MMAAGRQRKRRFATILAGLGLSASLVAGLDAGLGAGLATSLAWAATNEQIVSDPQTGLAISGYDPVAYFTEGEARQGITSFERSHDGVVWRFRNEGNRAAFADAPEVYMPRYGGYDPVAVARGKSVPGHPLFWAITDNKLYLFYDAQSRAAFSSAPARYAAEAEGNWAQVRAQLAR